MRPRRSRFSSFTAKIYNIGIDNIYCQKQTGFIRVGNGESLKKIAGNFCADRSYTYNWHTIAGLGLKGTRVFLKTLVAVDTHWPGCPAPLYSTTVLLLGPPASQPRIPPA
ncbi:putative transposase, IS630 family [Trichinella spiralis]|uniref:putative transposase, IS630 family n=1 Tax=Trichinella spiralis TaxID=6334 RepID=UPI0001EFEB90|nr:putative transposase, IS630 family [Trichinella spiralis]